ncbi:MAG: NUDIX hydrolase [Candidatus Delongbacteria bacterium]|nr:NUDIX hydrolase [Candidatus Delongbacteria bacterium]MBN2834206.1 NUDIX hydrolase [Candidatus Delongbacteria bacterium]
MAELIDEYDKYGNLTGFFGDHRSVKIRGNFHRIVQAFILNDKSELMLIKRSDKLLLSPGQYGFPGGHVDHGENSIMAIVRELMEELGISIDQNSLIPLTCKKVYYNIYNMTVASLKEIYLVYLNENFFNINTNEIDSYTFLDIEDIIVKADSVDPFCSILKRDIDLLKCLKNYLYYKNL